jgi:hypothetical protein
MEYTRQQLIDGAGRIRADIEQIFTDADSWNQNHRPEGESPIDPDPDGELAKCAKAIDGMLAKEAARFPRLA